MSVGKIFKCHEDAQKAMETRESLLEVPKVILVGNPNVGKSVVFGLLTKRYVTVSNYPGTTVEIAYGKGTFNAQDTVVVDTPGINNLIPMSEEERVTRDILLREKQKTVVQIADAKNLRRALLITLQLLEMEVPLVLDVNMVDEAETRGIRIDFRRLSQELGIPVVGTVAIRRKGLSDLIRSISWNSKHSTFRVSYDPAIEEAIKRISKCLPSAPISKRSLALMILCGDQSLKGWLFENLSHDQIQEVEAIRAGVQTQYTEPLGHVIMQARFRAVNGILSKVYSRSRPKESSFRLFLEKYAIHPLWGVVLVLLVLYGLYQFVGVFGAGTLVDFLEGTLFGKLIIPQLIYVVDRLMPVSLLRDLLVGEYGLLTMALSYAFAIILPIVGTFFVAFALLEDSGYLPRLAVVINRPFRIMGLNGKAVLPMVLGLGCDTMATLTTRILETKKERLIVTLLLALGIPCSAQLGVILGMLGSLSGKALVIWGVTVVGVLLIVGYLSSKVLPGKGSDFILELPPLRVPVLSNVFKKTLARIEWYLREAVPLFFLGTFILFVGHRTGLLQLIEAVASPVVSGLLNLPGKTTEAFLVGFLRRDYGAAGLFAMAQRGQLDAIQTLVSMVTINLFVPCIANFFIIVKERGMRTALAIVAFIFPFAFLVGGLLNLILRQIGISL